MRTRAHMGTWLAALFFFAASACSPAPLVVKTYASSEPSAPHVVVLKSGHTAVHEAALQSFVQNTRANVRVYSDLSPAVLPRVLEDVEKRAPALVLTLGAKATIAARDGLPEVPILFALVLSHRRLNLHEHPRIAGIAMEVAPFSECMQFKMVMPSLSRVLVLYAPDVSSDLVANARREFQQMGVMVIAAPVQDRERIAEQYRAYRENVDAVWLINDPKVLRSFAQLRDLAHEDGLPVFTSLSESFTEQGALMSVSIDIASLGSQAAGMAHKLLTGLTTPAQLGVQPPIGTRLVVNEDTAARLKVKVPPEILPFVHRVIRKSDR